MKVVPVMDSRPSLLVENIVSSNSLPLVSMALEKKTNQNLRVAISSIVNPLHEVGLSPSYVGTKVM